MARSSSGGPKRGYPSSGTVARGQEDCPAASVRNDILQQTRRLGRANWTRSAGYHVRRRVEALMTCPKASGKRIASRDPDRQAAEIQIRIAIMNQYNALGTAEFIAGG